MKDYLKKRHQLVRVKITFSTWDRVISGVSQGANIRPNLLEHLLKNLFFFIENSDISTYSDTLRIM